VLLVSAARWLYSGAMFADRAFHAHFLDGWRAVTLLLATCRRALLAHPNSSFLRQSQQQPARFVDEHHV
jgi:hypothetical protein